jgi:hypothetical protein
MLFARLQSPRALIRKDLISMNYLLVPEEFNSLKTYVFTDQDLEQCTEIIEGKTWCSWNSGVKFTEEHKRKISESKMGYKHSEETKQKLSKSTKGRKAWNKGIKMSDKFCDDISKRMKGKKRRLGSKLSQESKDKISKALKKHHERI